MALSHKKLMAKRTKANAKRKGKTRKVFYQVQNNQIVQPEQSETLVL